MQRPPLNQSLKAKREKQKWQVARKIPFERDNAMATVFSNKKGPSFCSQSSLEPPLQRQQCARPSTSCPCSSSPFGAGLTLGTKAGCLPEKPAASLAPSSSLSDFTDFSLTGTQRCRGPQQQRFRPRAGVLSRRGCRGQVPFVPREEEHFVKKLPWSDMLHFPANNRARYTTA